MLLRRVIKHVRNQEWTAIGIDFLIVVVGVFVGLQVSNWSAARDTDRQSAVFTERLTADLRVEAYNYQFLVEYYDDVLVHARKALSILEGKSSASDEDLLISAYRATQYNEAYRRRSTYDELTSTGTIGLIRDQALRLTAIRVYTAPLFEDITNEGQYSRYRQAFRMAVPVEVQNAIAEHCGDRIVDTGDDDYAAIVDMLDYDCATGLSPDVIANAANDLRSNETLVPLLRLRVVNIQSEVYNFTVNNADISLALDAITEDQP